MASIEIHVNGTKHELDIDPSTPLLWVLRDHLQLLGTKYGCGVAQCGACTVLVDDNATRSCILPISSVGTSKITTIEGLSEDGNHPLQKAWIEQDVPQCGYCQAGQIMNAAGLLRNNPKPSIEEIKQSMNGNICRCGTYLRIQKAILQAVK